jgi:hypothetical protein
VNPGFGGSTRAGENGEGMTLSILSLIVETVEHRIVLNCFKYLLAARH